MNGYSLGIIPPNYPVPAIPYRVFWCYTNMCDIDDCIQLTMDKVKYRKTNTTPKNRNKSFNKDGYQWRTVFTMYVGLTEEAKAYLAKKTPYYMQEVKHY